MGAVSDVGTAIVSILLAIIGLAIIAVLVSAKANTAAVLAAGGNAFSGILGAAESPVTGSGIGGIASGIANGVLGTGR